MLFNSYIFLLAFLPLCLTGYFFLNYIGKKKLSLWYLFGMSLWFYGSNLPQYLLLILGSIAVNFGFYSLSKKLEGGPLRRAALIAAVLINLGVLFYYKYYDFFASSVNAVFGTSWTLKYLMLPLGISFFTFQQLSFVIDSFRGEVPDYDFISYACFVTYFPQLIAGPIVTHDELVPQLMSDENKRFDWENISRGIYIFAIGLAKKVLLADVLGMAVNAVYTQLELGNWQIMNSGDFIIVMLSYTFQIYFDFSGYSDMAIGIGRMFNIDLPQNFNSPYKSLSIVEFWKRWHLTLTRFLTKYVYFPLGGSRRGTLRTYLNILAVFLISGLWHGAGWTFIVWGGLHGLFNVVSRWGEGFFDKLPKAVNWFITFVFVNIAWLLFRSDDLAQAFTMIGRIFEFDFGPISPYVSSSFQIGEVQMLLSVIPLVGRLVYLPGFMMWLFLAVCLLLVLVPKNAYEKTVELRPRPLPLLMSSLLLVWCIFAFGQVSSFLYFNF